MVNLTKRTVESIAVGAREVVAWDDTIKGFGVRVYPSGRRAYFLQYRVGGGRGGTARKPSIGVHGSITAQQARAIAQRWMGEVRAGRDPGGERLERRGAPTVADLCERYLKDHARPTKKPGGAHGDERMIELYIKPRLGSRKVADVTTGNIDRVLVAVETGLATETSEAKEHVQDRLRGGPYMANRVRALLSMMFSLADRWAWRPDHVNPVKYARKYPERKRERFLSPDELARLGMALAEIEAEGSISREAVMAIRLLVFTGCRVGEVLSLRWEHVDFDHACLRLTDSKTGPKVVYLSAPALDILAACPRVEKNEYVLPGACAGAPLSGIQAPWARVRARADLDGVRLHDLRHSFASVGASAGVPLLTIGALLGHADPDTTARYAHLSPDPVRKAVETIGATLAASLSGKPGGEVIPLPSRRRHEGA